MKKSIKLFLNAVMGAVLASCNIINPPTEYKLSDLQGLWVENNTEHYVRFTTEQSDETGYLYGREWDDAQDVHEEDLLPKGNGWFKYKFETNGNLTEIHLMDDGGSEIPKVYVVTVLTDTNLEYYEKEHSSSKFKFSKVINPILD